MTIESIALWHKRARPEPSYKDFNVQLGCHIEEFSEMLDTLRGDDGATDNKIKTLSYLTKQLADSLKSGSGSAFAFDPVAFLDAMADQVVTAVGTAYCDGSNIVKAMDIVNTSNWSKYDENGQPIFNSYGKIAKGPSYVPPALESCVHDKS